MDFSSRLKELRTQKGYSQSELAKKLGVSKSTISMMEVGSRKPSFETMEAIADFFNVSMDYLRGEDDISLYFLDPKVHDVAMTLSKDSELLVLVERAKKDDNFRNRLLGIMELMENDK